MKIWQCFVLLFYEEKRNPLCSTPVSKYNDPGRSTNTSKFGGGYETGDRDRELEAPLCHC
jgi:hypothetical protein